jgi:phosphomannomutase
LDEQGPGTIIYDLRSSRVVAEVVRAHGGRPVKTRVGHSFIKALMRKEKALFAGELSFHFYFSDFFYCESGILAMLTVIKLLADSGKSLNSLIAPLCKYAHSGEINFRVNDQQAAMEAVAERFSAGEISRLDGLSVDFPDWWLNLRPSNTEPLLRLNVEAETKELLREKLDEIKSILTTFS